MRSSAQRIGWRAVLLVLVVGCGERVPPAAPAGELRLGAVLGETDLVGFAQADEPRAFSFPADHGAHPAFRSEWWYFTATLADEADRPLGVQFTMFRQALAPDGAHAERPPGNRWQTNQVYLAHFAVTDAAAGEHRSHERFARGHPELAGVRGDPFRLWLEDWTLESQDAQTWQLRVNAAEEGAELALALVGPPVLQGEAGLSRKGAGQASYYYSMPRIRVAGVVRAAGVERTVSGSGWLDREWSTSVLSPGQLGWDWFALSLDDGRRIMLFRLRRADGSRDPFDQGMLSVPGAADRPLAAADFEVRPIREWRDEHGVAWPVAFDVRVGAQRWSVEAVIDDQRMDTTIRYWEGLVSVRDAEGARIGRGYLELTGYDRPGEVPRLEEDRDDRR
ncbi:MAG TPA: lipocalin-like domain-containing protein [Pseudomonadales bacterium]